MRVSAVRVAVRRAGALALIAPLFATACQDPEEPALESSAATDADRNRIDVRDVPIEIHRRAAQLLEDVRGSESAPGWERADLAAEVVVLERPDVDGPAYYEFRITGGERDAGYIIASATDGDFPIAHWDFTGRPPTAQLDELAKDRAIGVYYKLDTLSYAAEGERGELVANIGALPSRIRGQDPKWLDEPVADSTATWVPDRQTRSDEQARGVGGKLVEEGPPLRDIALDSWDSWEELKAGYRESYATVIESLRRQASEEWGTEALADAFGEGLIEGVPFELALLYPKAEVALDGEGSQVVAVDRVETAPGRELLILTARSANPGKELPLQVSIRYPEGQSEVKSFVVLSAEDRGGQAGKRGGVSWVEGGPSAAWGPWNTFFAGTHDDQRLYDQIPAGSSPNTSGCYSGCGATAWTMLFGWGDFRAGQGDPGWAHRFGLYRAGGGFGADAVAPKFNDAGIRNVQWEVRNRVGTFCAFGSGATFPWEMSDASGYLSGRTGASLTTNYNVLGIHTGGLRDTARDSIVNRRVPAIIGTGWLSHYPLAYGYRWRSRTVRTCFLFICWTDTEYQRQFYVNQGWGGSSNGWVGAGTWFAGRLFAN